jgi:DNA (cytosine-5)-methyltransferase 1
MKHISEIIPEALGHLKPLKVLNNYCGLGGNRDKWENVEVIAVEHNEEIASIYRERYPHDKVIVADAHEYLLNHYKEFDFIWTSSPCQSHSRARMWTSKGGRYAPKYPSMALYEEIIFLQHYAECQWVSENVIPYYEPLIKPTVQIDRHLFWSNFPIKPVKIENDADVHSTTSNSIVYGFDVRNYKIKHRKDQLLRNLVNPDLGLYILEQARGIIRQEKTEQIKLFK